MVDPLEERRRPGEVRERGGARKGGAAGTKGPGAGGPGKTGIILRR